jgi:signal peptidase II
MRRAALFLVLLVVLVGCDHATKRIAEDALAGTPGFSVVADTLRFELASNRGAFLSIGESLPPQIREGVLIVLVPVLLLGVCAMAIRSGMFAGLPLIGLALIVGGGGANWIDRILHDGAVTDFVSFGIGPLRTGIFNLADVFIFAGVGLLLTVRTPKRDDAEDAEPTPEVG